MRTAALALSIFLGLGFGLGLASGCTSPSSVVETGSAGSSEATSAGTSSESAGTGSESGSETGETGDPPGNPLLSDRVLNIAHRGGGRLRPEATLPAFANALDVGADVLEFDLHASADGVLVIIHDDTVDRTTDGTGKVSELSFAELRSFDAGYWFTTDGGQTYPYRGMGIQIPTLDEVFEQFPDRTYLIEIKQAEPSIVPAFSTTLADHGVTDNVVVASFQQAVIDEVRAADPELFTAMTLPEMLDFNSIGGEPGYVAPCLFVQPPWDLTDQALVDKAHALGLYVHPWTINSAATMQDQIALGVDGIMTDDPALLASVLGG